MSFMKQIMMNGVNLQRKKRMKKTNVRQKSKPGSKRIKSPSKVSTGAYFKPMIRKRPLKVKKLIEKFKEEKCK